ncbi:MAG: glycine cleavage system protein T [Desulfobacterales bacterium]|nr:MAG: glycine cleavage system protein T [Desulfobacterales bacterium]
MKKTPLYKWHRSNGANMASFGEYSMPLWYEAGAKKEHLAVISTAGLFDTSHMSGITVKGAGARSLIQRCFSKDLERCIGINKKPLAAGRSNYGIFATESGHVLDDGLVSQVTEDLYFIVVNSGMGSPVCKVLSDNRGDRTVTIKDHTDALGKIDIQGPLSGKILAGLLADAETVLETFPYFSFKGWFDSSVDGVSPVRLKDGTEILLSRTGYTGEFGFEIFVHAEKTEILWKTLLAAGAEKGLLPCGLAARDSLRAGAVLPLSHQDIGDWPFAANPWPFALAEKDESGTFTADFIGAKALANHQPTEFTYPFAGFDLRKIATDEGHVVDEKGETLGIILTCATDMAIGRIDKTGPIVSIATPKEKGRPEDFKAKGLCCGFIKVDKKLSFGDIVYLTDGKRKLKVEIREDIRPDRTARKAIKKML